MKKKRHPTSTASGKERAQTCPKTTGLAQKVKIITASEACSHGKSPNFPDTKMIDVESISSTYPGPENPRIAEQVQQASGSKKGKEAAREELSRHADTSATKIAMPHTKSTVTTNISAIPPEFLPGIESDMQLAARSK